LLKAWKKIRGVPIKFVGDGSLIEETRKIAIRKNLHDVELLGIIDRKDVLTLMEKAIFLVFPSECYEGFPMTVAEAFACGLPVLSSRIGGMTEIVENGVTGLHFEPGDSDGLADKAQWLVDNPDVCARMGKNARQVFLEKYSANKNYEILMDIYQKAIDENK
jgi:glycosyltransferase involved in cell wall biosynthesis